MIESIEKLEAVRKKLDKESADITGNKEKAMMSSVKTALISFCKQESEFAQAILESKQTFKDCMSAVAKNSGNCLSDLEAYRRAVQFYFPGADIEFKMKIDLCASVNSKDDKNISLSLMDLL